MFVKQFPECGNPRCNGIILLLDSFVRIRRVGAQGAWGPFLESPGNFTGLKSNIQI